jgi:hypothetical protein
MDEKMIDAAQRAYQTALSEAVLEERPMCVFNHPHFPGDRFILNEGNWPPQRHWRELDRWWMSL